jgi:hypothetical protein
MTRSIVMFIKEARSNLLHILDSLSDLDSLTKAARQPPPVAVSVQL